MLLNLTIVVVSGSWEKVSEIIYEMSVSETFSFFCVLTLKSRFRFFVKLPFAKKRKRKSLSVSCCVRIRLISHSQKILILDKN